MMRTDEEIIAQENMKFIAQVLLEIIEYIRKGLSILPRFPEKIL